MGLYEDILAQPVSTLALRDLVAVSPDTPVREVVERLCEKGLGCAIVVDAAGRPTGMFTERVLARTLSRRPDMMGERVGDHLEPEWAAVTKGDPIVKVLAGMRAKGMRFVCVTDGAGRAVALTGQKGLMEFFADHFPRHVQIVIRHVGAESFAHRREGE